MINKKRVKVTTKVDHGERTGKKFDNKLFEASAVSI